MKNNFKNHLSKYSKIDGTALMLTPIAAIADVVYTNPVDTANLLDVYIDFNNDGTNDVHMSAGAQPGVALDDVWVDVLVLGKDSLGDSSNHYGAAYGSGKVISAAGDWTNNEINSGVLMYSGIGEWAGANQ